MKITKFEELNIWRVSIEITKEVYQLTKKDVFHKDFGLQSQIRRASVSISSNIVEGFEKNNNNGFVRYLRIAKGSIGELRNQLYISLAINYIDKKDFSEIDRRLELLAMKIGRLISYLTYKRTNKEFVSKK